MGNNSFWTALFSQSFGKAVTLILVGVAIFVLPELVNGLYNNMPGIKSFALCVLGGALVGTGVVSLGNQ